jgi:hypothetical protein
MAVSNEQYNRILSRLTKIEENINDMMVAMNHYVEMGQVQQLLTIVTTQVADLTNTVAALEDRVESIEEEPLT